MKRRIFLLTTITGSAAILLSACGAATAPTPTALAVSPATPTPAALASPVNASVITPTAAAAAVAPSSSGPVTIRIAYQRGGLPLVTKFRGEVQKKLTDLGITLAWVGPFPDAPTGYEALRANSADFFSSSTAPAVSTIAGGNPLKLVAATPSSPDGNAVLVYKDSEVQKVADLIGKKVAVQHGNVAEYTWLKTLEAQNIPKDKVERVYISPPDAAAALSQKKVDAWVTWDPYIAIAQTQNGARIIADGSAAPDFGVWAVTTALITARQDAVRNVLVELQNEGTWANANLSDAIHIEGNELKLPDTVVNQLITRHRNYKIGSIDDATRAKMQTEASWFHDAGVIPSAVDLSQAVVSDMVRR